MSEMEIRFQQQMDLVTKAYIETAVPEERREIWIVLWRFFFFFWRRILRWRLYIYYNRKLGSNIRYSWVEGVRKELFSCKANFKLIKIHTFGIFQYLRSINTVCITALRYFSKILVVREHCQLAHCFVCVYGLTHRLQFFLLPVIHKILRYAHFMRTSVSLCRWLFLGKKADPYFVNIVKSSCEYWYKWYWRFTRKPSLNQSNIWPDFPHVDIS